MRASCCGRWISSHCRVFHVAWSACLLSLVVPIACTLPSVAALGLRSVVFRISLTASPCPVCWVCGALSHLFSFRVAAVAVLRSSPMPPSGFLSSPVAGELGPVVFGMAPTTLPCSCALYARRLSLVICFFCRLMPSPPLCSSGNVVPPPGLSHCAFSVVPF